MISILIPTFNYNVTFLVNEVHKQALLENIIFEIICFDDGSNSTVNDKNNVINKLLNAQFVSKKENIGLSNNRNELAKHANYDYLLFIDGDSLLPNKNFIKTYIKALSNKVDVIYGGRIHPESVSTSRKLRWKYGIYREDIKPEERIKNAYKCVLFNNTIIRKNTFEKIGFEKKITQYGHEDTIFAYELSKIQAAIKHIENPVIHGDVDYNSIFFNKMHSSLKNLNFIYTKSLIEPRFITFLQIFEKLKKYKLNYFFALLHKLFYPLFCINLRSNKPFLFVFDLFRLSYFCHINLKK